MKAEEWPRIKELLDLSIALDPSERPEFLDRACDGNTELRREVESLLASHDQAGTSFLKKPALDLKPEIFERAGRRVGAYQLLQKIGEGGMGEVFRAVRADGQYTKEVAVKLVRGGYDSASIQERFRNERQILASLDHTNIARLLDGGTTDDGVPYLVMELIDGTPIDQYCDDRDLDVDERLRLFTQVCAAVQYAHQRLVIHRDIKPGNILVTAEGVPKLLDFGIAKIFDPTSSAETTIARPMTPEYASPEQIRGEPITTASDVYSLGVVLYRLLTGRSPYPANTRATHEFARAICEHEPLRPSTTAARSAMRTAAPNSPEISVRAAEGSPAKLRRRLRGDLDDIVLMALRKEPQRRYASVEQFAEDIRRHLEGLPIAARKGSWHYRTGKFVRRHRLGIAASGVVALSLLAGLITTVREARIAEANRHRAEARFNDVRKLANSFLFEFDDAIKNLPGSTPARSLLVKRAVEYLDGLASEARGDRSLQMEIASGYQKVAEVQGNPMFPNLGDSKGALQSSRKSLAILELLSSEEPANQQVRQLLAGNHQQISDMLSFSGDIAGAVEHSGKALKMYESLAGNLASDRKFQAQRVTQTYHYANLLRLTGALDEAAAEYRQAVELSRQMIAAHPSDPEGKVHLATSLDGLGYVLQEKGDTAGALENRSGGLTIREELAKLDPNNAHYGRQLAFSHHNVGLSLMEAGDLASALANFRQELSLFESLSAPDPKNVQARRNLSLAHKQIGDVLMRADEFRGALAAYRAALEIDRDLTFVDPGSSQALLDLSLSESKVGSALEKLGQTQAALAILRSGVVKQESLLAKDPHHILLYHDLGNSYTLLADSLLNSGDRKPAIEYYRKAVAARLAFSEKSPNSGANNGALAQCYSNLGKALVTTDSEDALKQYSNAIGLLERLTASDRSNAQDRITFADALSNAARLYVRMAEQNGNPSTRVRYLTKARSSFQRSQELWLDLRRAGKLTPAREVAIRDLSSDLARCNDSLAKLQHLQ